MSRQGVQFEGKNVKANTHPKLHVTTIRCSCGNTFETLATVENMREWRNSVSAIRSKISVASCSAFCEPILQKGVSKDYPRERFLRISGVKLRAGI